MLNLVPMEFGTFYGLVWFGFARLAVAGWRAGQRARCRREMVVRLERWKYC